MSRRKKYSKVCKGCKKEFKSSSRNTQYCDDCQKEKARIRTQTWRKRRKEKSCQGILTTLEEDDDGNIRIVQQSIYGKGYSVPKHMREGNEHFFEWFERECSRATERDLNGLLYIYKEQKQKDAYQRAKYGIITQDEYENERAFYRICQKIIEIWLNKLINTKWDVK